MYRYSSLVWRLAPTKGLILLVGLLAFSGCLAAGVLGPGKVSDSAILNDKTQMDGAVGRSTLVGPTPSVTLSAEDVGQASGAAASLSGSPLIPASELSAGTDNRLSSLWRERTQKRSSNDYPLGPGDVIEISAPAIQELKDAVVRVSNDGTLSLPYIGTLQVDGRREKDLEETVVQRLDKYVINPRVAVFVKEYRSRRVAVTGAVDKPGLYDLVGNETILDVIGRAGGMKPEAGGRILLIPCCDASINSSAQMTSRTDGRVQLSEAESANLGLLAGHDSKALVRTTSPIVIDFSRFSRGENQKYLALPARPGDVIVVPAAGEVLVQGWVQKPGSYKITPGLTLLGAVAAAGGLQFPGSDVVKLIRSRENDQKIFLAADLADIKSGRTSDLAIEEGDVIDVPYSTIKAIPYGLYSLIGKGFYFGATATPF